MLFIITDIDYCPNVTCLHNGVCTEAVVDFICICTVGYTGKTCEIGKYFVELIALNLVPSDLVATDHTWLIGEKSG